MQVGGTDLHGVLEHRLNESDDRRVRRLFVGAQGLQVDVALVQLFTHFLRDRRDLVRAAIDHVHGLEQVGFLDERETQRLLQARGQLVVGHQVRRVGHADEQAARVRLQHQRAETAGLHFWQQAYGLLIERQLAHVDERDLQVRGEQLVQLLFAHQAHVGQYAAELAAAALLFVERALQLLGGEQLLLEQQLAEPDFLAAVLAHCSLPLRASSSTRSLDSFTSCGQSPSLTTSGRSRITSSVVLVWLRSLRNNLPSSGTSLRNGVL